MIETLGADWYTSDIVHRAEHESIWRTEWFMIATVDELSTHGSYVADTVAGWPIAVVRDPDGVLRAFLNVCPHRAGVIVWPGTGRAGNLVCRYHGWAFDWEGNLRSARDFGAVPCRESDSLTMIRVETWGPLVFVCLDSEAPSLADSSGDLGDRLGDFTFGDMRHAKRLERTLECNWKTYVDNYLEAYHVPLLHPMLGAALDMSTYEVTIPHSSYCLHRSGTTENSVSAGLWVFRYPNLAINVYPDAMNVERIVPLSTTRTKIIYDYFAVDTSDDSVAPMLEMSNVTLDEDQRIAEAVQVNLASGAYRSGTLSPKHEQGLAWFQSRVRASVSE